MTMPMRLNGSFKKSSAQDIEFGGQTSEQKRKSMKRMSKVVEVNDSAEQDQSENRQQKVKHGDHMFNGDSNQVQSLQSLAQVTDTEDETKSKRQQN